MATFVLVHGAMHGGWCWGPVASRLRAAGHEVHTPTLSGQGDRARTATRETGLDDHVDDLRATLFYEDATEVVLVGHSYGSVVTEQLADRHPERLSALVHLHGFVPRDGECLLDVQPSGNRERYQAIADEKGSGWLIPPEPWLLERWGIPDELADWVLARLVAFPLRCNLEPVRLSNPRAAEIPRTYVQQSGEPLRTILAASEERARERGALVEEIDAQHDSMLTHSDEVTEALLQASERSLRRARSS